MTPFPSPLHILCTCVNGYIAVYFAPCSVCKLFSPHPAACQTVGNVPLAMLKLGGRSLNWGMGIHSYMGPLL